MVLKKLTASKQKIRILQSYIIAKHLLKLNKIGRNFVCGFGVKKSKKNLVTVGNNVYIGHRCFLSCDLEIGDNVLIASNVAFVGGDHRFDLPGKNIRDSGIGDVKSIKISNDVWIGHGVIILTGVTVGEGSIIGAGSVVTKDVSPFSVNAGNPAKKIKDRFSNN